MNLSENISTINFPAIKEIADVGVRRASVFMGLGINAANNEVFTDYELAHMTQIQIVDSNADQKKLEHYKDEFKRWIVTCGLRELIETFAVFLDHIHSACLTMSLYKKTVSPKEAARNQKAFSRMGLKEKLQHLETSFNINTAFNDYLFTINQVRNCLAHRRGLVGVQDCNNQQELTINWQRFFIFGETPDGKVVSLDLPIPKEGILFKDGAAIKLSIKESAKSFPIGARVELTPKELHEICLIIFRATADICTTAVDYAKLINIPIRYVDK